MITALSVACISLLALNIFLAIQFFRLKNKFESQNKIIKEVKLEYEKGFIL